MKNYLFVSGLMLLINSFGQVYKFKETVYISNKISIYRKDKVPNCEPASIPAGSNLVGKQTYTNDGVEYTATNTSTATGSEKKDKHIETGIKLSGKGRLYFSDKDDKNIVRINYFLNPSYIVKAGEIDKTTGLPKTINIKIQNYKINCAGLNVLVTSTDEVLSKDTRYNLVKVDPNDKNYAATIAMDWYKYSPKIITVYKTGAPAGTVDYYLVDKYSSDIDYYIKLDNNYYISLPTTSFDFGPITIPLKIRPGFSKTINGNKIDISSSVEGDLNIGVFGGLSIGRSRFRYQKTEMKELSKVNFTIGGFIGVSKQDVDSLSSNVSNEPLGKDIKKNFATISPGIGIMATIYNFQLGFLFGIDAGIGKNAKSWNFNNRPWIGIGLGYSLSSLWKK